MFVPEEIFIGIQVLTTLGIIVLPAIAQHPKNPYQKRTRSAINRLKRKDDDVLDLVEFSEFVESERGYFFRELLQYFDINPDNLRSEIEEEGVLDEISVGFIQRGDCGFKILLEAISQNRAIDKEDVTTIGLMYGPVEIIESLEANPEMPQGGKVPIGPNAGLFVDYGNNSIPDRELVMYYPESPSLTLSLHELQVWTQEAIRRKFHYYTMILAVLWTLSSIITII